MANKFSVMSTINIIPYSADYSHAALADFEEVLHYSMLRYSMLHLLREGITSRESFNEALQKAMRVCDYAGISIEQHFKQVYAYDTDTGTMDIDWLMSKRGLKLIILEYPRLNKQLALWLWEWSDV
jgi:hypothetical protein